MNACRSEAPLAFMISGTKSFALGSAGCQVLSRSCAAFQERREFGCERGYAASAANSLAQLAFFNGLLSLIVDTH